MSEKETTKTAVEPKTRQDGNGNGHSRKVENGAALKDGETESVETHDETEAAKSDSQPETAKKQNRLPIFIVGSVLIIAAIAGTIYYLYSRQYESTDDAFIEGDIVQVSPKLTAYVEKVYVSENQRVKKGDLLFELDSRDFQTRLEQAQAQKKAAEAVRNAARANVSLTRQTTRGGTTQASSNLETARNNVKQTAAAADSRQTAIEQARSQLRTAQSTLAQNRAQIATAEANARQVQAAAPALQSNLRLAQDDFNRNQRLYNQGDVSKQTYDQAANRFSNAQSQLEAAQRQIQAAQSQVEVARQNVNVAQARIGEANSNVSAAEDNYRQSLAQIDLTRSQVGESAGRLLEANSAPEQIAVSESQVGTAEAQIAQANVAVNQANLELTYTKIYAPEDGFVTRKNVQEGQLVQPGQSLMAISQKTVWVVANFKETQLEYMKLGQPVTIEIDAYPGESFTGRIESFQAGTGSRFSVLPAENATGNYVKVVQRVPVKIIFDEFPDKYFLAPGMSVQPSVKIR
ncbi:MAG: HlyD family secretion protein [Pyrinomonadaceae bacterium]|nr:HlyD family secretion protein [Pyrinomonadaceae bacterium]